MGIQNQPRGIKAHGLKSVKVQARIPADLLQQIDAIAQENDCSRSGAIIYLLKRGIHEFTV